MLYWIAAQKNMMKGIDYARKSHRSDKQCIVEYLQENVQLQTLGAINFSQQTWM